MSQAASDDTLFGKLAGAVEAVDGMDPRKSALLLLWTLIAFAVVVLITRGGRRLVRQVYAVAVLAFREGLRMKVLWTVFALALIPGTLAYYSDADGTHAGRARLILNYCLSTGELLSAVLIVLLSALSVAHEIESRIMHTLGAKPIPRWGILAGKALGFWALDLLFLAGLATFASALVRAVPLRAETRGSGALVESGGWEDLRRNALTTRVYRVSDSDLTDRQIQDLVAKLGADDSVKHGQAEQALLQVGIRAMPMLQEAGNSQIAQVRDAARKVYDRLRIEQGVALPRMIKPGASSTWKFSYDPAETGNEAVALRFQFSSSHTFASQIKDLGVKVVRQDEPGRPLLEFTRNVPQDRPFELFVNPGDLSRPGVLAVTLTAAKLDATSPNLIGHVKLGLAADALAGNMLKAFLLMALQGWILALITTGWSGVLSFPVTVALGVILVLGGEMSRQALELLQTGASRAQSIDMDGAEGGSGAVKSMVAQIRAMLMFIPDFRAAGGPAAFVDGQFQSGWVLAHVAFTMGILRTLAWSIPGALLFQRREVGR